MNGFCSQLVAAAGSIVTCSHPVATEQKHTQDGGRQTGGEGAVCVCVRGADDDRYAHMKQQQLLQSLFFSATADKVLVASFISSFSNYVLLINYFNLNTWRENKLHFWGMFEELRVYAHTLFGGCSKNSKYN